MAVTLAFLALVIEAAVGYPPLLLRTIGHPVTWMGAMIGALERRFNNGVSVRARRSSGLAVLASIVVIVFAVAFAIERILLGLPFGILAVALLASTLLAQRSLHDHVARVATALEKEGLDAARTAVAHIVGRDPEALDEAGVARAAIESLAENFSDGVVAPVFWTALGGLATGAAYKAINTADSMLGHRTERLAAFGWASARLDDLVNLPASRLSALLLIMAAGLTPGASAAASFRAVRRDAHRHRSPNAGYPEAAMAGALGLALAGPRVYGGSLVEDAMMGDGRRHAAAPDIRAALGLYRRADALLITLLAALAVVFSATG
ncbi:MAG: cobalamin biosynthesis protein CobD [Hyphomicrobiales bacterium]|nr:cobalamin biosynthesis protein CobD [Hyphomicrobiales bacterium]MBV9428148.1 cobalamin biosynthesis protein CobD [Bradyrhizobiaceae bacterium]